MSSVSLPLLVPFDSVLDRHNEVPCGSPNYQRCKPMFLW
jgi:hypothetical protein